MLCYRRIHPWCATSHYDEARPIICSFCASSSSGRAHFQVRNVQMRKHFVISGCAADTVPVVADEPALTVHSSDKDMTVGDEHPLVEEPLAAQPSSVPLVDRMVCVQAHRSSQTAPFIVPDIHRVLEGTGVLEWAASIRHLMFLLRAAQACHKRLKVSKSAHVRLYKSASAAITMRASNSSCSSFRWASGRCHVAARMHCWRIHAQRGLK